MVNSTTLSSLLEAATTALPSKEKPHLLFSWYDYGLFSTMLAISGLIGIYFGCCGKKQNTTKEYLMGGKKMKVIPIAISLVASHTSGITLLALPADVYVFGATYWLGSISMMILSVITVYVYLPVFYNLHLTSTYEYLGRRFDDKTRKCASFLFALALFVYLPIVIYIPALAFSAATGVDVHVITPIVCSVCIFYTTLGGLKALVWSDTLQFSITVGAMTTIFILGVNATGGFANMWQKSVESERLDIFDFDFDFTKRESFWAVTVGLTIHWVSHTSINQGCTQKFLSVATLEESKRSVIYYCFGMVIMKTLSVLCGLAMYAKYSDCDPFTSKHVSRNDQLLPYYVMDVAGSIPGLSGLFIAGIFSAALSTLSANLNCLAGTIYEDFLKARLERKGPHKNAGYILKLIVVITGVVSTAMVYVVENLGGLLAISIGLGSVAHGPLLGMFTLGVLFPRANSKGAFYGGLSSMFCMGTVITVANYYKSQKLLKYPTKPVSIDGCDFSVNSTITSAFNSTVSSAGTGSDIFPIFRISFYWYTMFGAIIGITVGMIISYLTERNDPPVPMELLSPVTYPFLPEENKSTNQNYYTVNVALEKVSTDKGRKSLKIEENEERLRKASYVSETFDD
ncbi:sodium-coupled monocarboxylate transporter 1 [Anoplophora glabripennis]|nr:sodium-coupled monocarboxylate transporter 1 [Anoplophora glabripennis]